MGSVGHEKLDPEPWSVGYSNSDTQVAYHVVVVALVGKGGVLCHLFNDWRPNVSMAVGTSSHDEVWM